MRVTGLSLSLGVLLALLLQPAHAEAAYEALPEPERLTLARCKPCHAEGNYMSQRHNRLGWELVILRMQHLNGARMADGERGVIANYLTQKYPATGGARLMEAVQQLAGALVPVWLWIAWKSGRSRFRQRAGTSAGVNKGA